MTRTCNRCSHTKPLDQFRMRDDQRSTICRTCDAARRKLHRDAQKQPIRQRG